uniref:Uncharacterized protein n=1 Tax=Plectus sambesii TaxID=2011161 RepID=A0A914VRQ8_9BILA
MNGRDTQSSGLMDAYSAGGRSYPIGSLVFHAVGALSGDGASHYNLIEAWFSSLSKRFSSLLQRCSRGRLFSIVDRQSVHQLKRETGGHLGRQRGKVRSPLVVLTHCVVMATARLELARIAVN